MADTNIKISQLNPLGTLSRYDFFPVDQSSSLTTFRTDINTLNTWFAASGSASYSSTASYVKNAVSASYVPNLNPQTYQASCSWASASISSSYSNTSSAANSITFIPNLSNTASYIISSHIVGIVNSSSYALTASHSNSSSYASTASYALASRYSGPTFISPISVITDATSGDSVWTLFECPVEIIPIGTSTLILDGWASQYEQNDANFIRISPTDTPIGDTPILLACGGQGAGSGTTVQVGGQGTFPCASSLSTSSSFYYYSTQLSPLSKATIRVVGYY